MTKIFFAVFIVCFFASLAQTRQDVIINAPNGKPLFNLIVADARDYSNTWTMPQEYIEMFKVGLNYWSFLLGNFTANSVPVPILTGAIYASGINASGGSAIYSDGGGMTMLANGLYSDSLPYIAMSYADITLQEPSGGGLHFWTGAMTLLPHGGNLFNLASVVAHELGHAMGIMSLGDNNRFESYDYFSNLMKYDYYLVDINNNRSSAGKSIVLVNSINPSANTFQLLNVPIYEYGQGVAFFQGPKTLEVLGGYIYGNAASNPNRVRGMPINGFESGYAELSHLELRNSMMSHQNYRNWNTFMEAELALLEDIGIIIDRKNFYGFSLYSNDENIAISSNFYARNDEGTQYIDKQFNNTPWTIGLHIYGSNNIVSMDGEVLTKGYASAGIRIDGWENELTINGNIQSDGEYGVGLMIAYGKNHSIIHKSVITANGENGIGAMFDFGDNVIGNSNEYRGSYIRTRGSLNDELKGALVNSFDITGLISASYAAIYISSNAFVQKINIMKGANISGNIISNWNKQNSLIQNFGQGVMITTITFGLKADDLGKALLTPDDNFSLIYAGDILAKNASMDIIIYGGTLTYKGSMSGLNTFTISSQAALGIIVVSLTVSSIQALQINFNSNHILITLQNVPFSYESETYTYDALILDGQYNGENPNIIANGFVPIGFYNYYGEGLFSPAANGEPAKISFIVNDLDKKILRQDLAGGAAKTGALFMSLQNPAGSFIFKEISNADDSKNGVWIRPSYIYSTKAGNDGWSIENGAISLGFGNKDMGIVFAQDSLQFKSAFADIDADIMRGILYLSFKSSFVDTIVYGGIGFNNYHQNRSFQQETFDSKYDGSQYEAGAQISKTIDINKKVKVKPFMELALINLDIENYIETNISSYALSFQNQNYGSYQIKTGIALQYIIDDKFDISIGSFYKFLFGDKASQASVSFANVASDSVETIDNKWQEMSDITIGVELDCK
ncbi:MAG: autotransporter domain-containing protein, partial [Elusimicrobiota bacterium]|nr:autotransporter domain-containing protein [Elusimicrobiota bacterium]